MMNDSYDTLLIFVIIATGFHLYDEEFVLLKLGSVQASRGNLVYFLSNLIIVIKFTSSNWWLIQVNPISTKKKDLYCGLFNMFLVSSEV